MPNFPKNKHLLPPNTHTYVHVLEGKKCWFFRKYGVLCFLEIPVLSFALLPYYRRNVNTKYSKNSLQAQCFVPDQISVPSQLTVVSLDAVSVIWKRKSLL